MKKVKFSNNKWLVLLNGSWIGINEKYWDSIRIKVWELDAKKEIYGTESSVFESWQPTPDQIYSLPDEVEFEIKRTPTNEKLPPTFLTNRWIEVAHLKDSEQKKEWTCEGGYKLCQKDDQGNCSCKVDRSE